MVTRVTGKIVDGAIGGTRTGRDGARTAREVKAVGEKERTSQNKVIVIRLMSIRECRH